MKPAVLIAGEHIALAAARSLSAAGVSVYALGHGEDPTRHSRHRRQFVEVGSGIRLMVRSMEWLRSKGPRGAVVIPCDDEGLELVAGNRTELAELGYLPIEADDRVLLAMLDKQRTYELAREIGVATPLTFVVETREEVIAAAERVGYPCALKPLSAHRWHRHFPLRTKAFVARDQAELERAVTRTQPLDLEVMVTELIPGGDERFCSYYGYLDSDGESLVHITKRKLRQYPPGFGLGTFHLTDRNPDVAAQGLRFLQGIGARGLACVEFKRDPRDEQLKLIECNHRLTGATEQLRAAGADLPLFVYRRLTGASPPPISDYRTAVSLWSPLLDARAFIGYRRRGELTLRRWIASLLRRHRFPIFRWSDPLPSLARGARKLRNRLLPR